MAYRSQQPNVRRVILVAASIVLAWMLSRVVKWQISAETDLGRYLWYGYYVFQASLPLAMLRIADLIGTGSERRRFPTWFAALGAFNLVLRGLFWPTTGTAGCSN